MNEKDIIGLLPESVRNTLGEESCKAIRDAFDERVEKLVNERVQVAVQGAERNFDNVMTERLEKLVKRMDEANKACLERVCAGLGAKAAAMRESYEARIDALKGSVASLKADRSRASRAMGKAVALIGEAAAERREHAAESEAAKDALVRVANRYGERIRETEEAGRRALSSLKGLYESRLARSVAAGSLRFKRRLVECVDRYIGDAVDRAVPYADIKAALRNRAATRLMESLKRMLGVDSAASLDTIKAPILEARQIIDGQRRRNRRLVAESRRAAEAAASREERLSRRLDEARQAVARKDAEKARLIESAKAQIAEAKRIAYLNERLASVPSKAQRNYMKRVMQDKSAEYIAENFDYILRENACENARTGAALSQRARDISKSREITEVSRRRLAEMNARPLTESAEPRQESDVDEVIDTIREDLES